MKKLVSVTALVALLSPVMAANFHGYSCESANAEVDQVFRGTTVSGQASVYVPEVTKEASYKGRTDRLQIEMPGLSFDNLMHRPVENILYKERHNSGGKIGSYDVYVINPLGSNGIEIKSLSVHANSADYSFESDKDQALSHEEVLRAVEKGDYEVVEVLKIDDCQ